MAFRSDPPSSETLPARVRVHVLGAGPVGLVVTALLQSNDRFSVHLYEKRRDYSRTRMVRLAEYLVADSIESYCTDYIDGESVAAIFEPAELAEGLANPGFIVDDEDAACGHGTRCGWSGVANATLIAR